MDALRVPTLPIEAEVLLTGGERLTGVLRLPAAAADHGGPPSLAEWLNGPDAFFPFQPQGRDDCLLLNKRELLVLSASSNSGGPDTPEGVNAPRRSVTVELEGFRYSGVVTIDLPAQHSRTLDVFNRPERFLTLHAGDVDHVVNKDRVGRATEGQ
jgi:hypothetical protein